MSGQLPPLVDGSHGGNVFPCIESDPSISPCLGSCHPTLRQCEEPISASLEVLNYELSLGSSPGWQALACAASLYKVSPASLVAFSWTCLSVALGAPKAPKGPRGCGLMDAVQRGIR